MKKLNSSKERGSFQASRVKPVNEEFLKLLGDIRRDKEIQEADPKWRENNLEYDLRSTSWILDKTKSSKHYAQNLYAALCNRQFQKRDTWPILKDQRWSCSWRYAGGIIADMREEGDYIDWYCSGIRASYDLGGGGDLEEGYISEGTVTNEIENDLNQLGWIVIDEKDDDRK